jgi:hypothetical protein
MPVQVKTVQKARQDQGECVNCHDKLPAGKPYRYFKPGFRSKQKIRVCLRPECTPRRSQLVTSRMSDAYSAVEDAETAVQDATTESDVKEALDECLSRIEEVMSEYEDSIQAAPMLETTLADIVANLEGLIDSLSGVEIEEFDDPAPTKPELNPDLSGDAAKDELKEAMADYEADILEWENARDESLADAKDSANDALSTLE